MRQTRPASLISALLFAGATTASSLGQTSLGELSSRFTSLTADVNRSVVTIMATSYSPARGLTSGRLISEARSTGSGVILSSDGYIVTNAHVVSGARRVEVLVPADPPQPSRSILAPNTETFGAQIVGIDEETDLAVLKIQAELRPDLPFLELADSDALKNGQLVFAFGSPLGLQNSVTMGVVSATARQLQPEAPMIYIQTDASINPGNSGGPLIDTEGRVVGINTIILSQSGGNEGLGFAAPSNIVRNVFEQLKASGRVKRGDIGIHGHTIDPMLQAGLGLTRSWGVVVSDVFPEGPAEAARVDRGDIIVSLDGKPMENWRQLRVNLYQRRVGDRVSLVVLRGDEELEFSVEVTERADDPNRFASLVHPRRNLIPQLGILGINLTPENARSLGSRRASRGILVAARSTANPASGPEGLFPGDVIYELNRQSMVDLETLRAKLDAMNREDAMVFLVERRRVLRYVGLKLR